MYSAEELERFYVEYGSEWVPRGMTLQACCSRNNSPYRVLDEYVKDIRMKVYEVRMESLFKMTSSVGVSSETSSRI